jgi:hypothetical protein
MRQLLEFLELLGLLIAMSDLFGSSPKVQAWINRKRRGFFFWLDANCIAQNESRAERHTTA